MAEISTPWTFQLPNSTPWGVQDLQPVFNLLLEDGISFFLQEDGSSKLQLE